MEMKQCPQCGKYGAADRTYCMNCGITLGIRCPSCRAVMPVGARTCTACNHSFVKKKKLFSFPLWKWMKTNAKPLVLGGITLLFVFCFVAAAFPAVLLTVAEPEAELPILNHTLTGYRLMGYFLGAHPADIEALMELRDLAEVKTTLQVLLFGQGFGLLLTIVALAFALVLAIPNYRRLARLTARRLYAPLGMALGGAAMFGGLSFVTSAVLHDGMVRYTQNPEDGFLVTTSTVWPPVVAIVALVVFALHTLMHLTVIGKQDSDAEELTLGQILSVPLGAVVRFVRFLWRKIFKKAAAKAKSEREEPAFTVTPRFSTYIVLLLVSLVFTQALLSKVSNIFFWFMFLLPIALCVYTLLCRGSLSVSMLSDTVTTEKNTPYTYEFRIDNHSILALPFVEALVSIPQSNSVRCTERTVRLSMAPMTGYHMKNTVRFRFRGTYDIGVRCFYIYDFFRLFRTRVDVENLTTIYVMPRRLSLDDTLAQAISDSTTRTVRSPLVVDKLEVSDIRDYQNGDSLKSIHWKLSSKSENFIVKDYNTGTSNQTVVFCDMTPHFPDEPPRKKTPEELAAEANAGKSKKQLRTEKKAAKKAEKERKAEEKTAAAGRRAKNKRVKETKDTHAITDEALQERLDQRAAAAEALDARNGKAAQSAYNTITVDTVDVHELITPAAYEDMNEYLADGVVELTIASVLAELRQGHEVMLLWFDRRSDSGVFAYPLRGADEFENIYHLFATAPLCAPTLKVTSLAAMLSDIQSAKQMFVISTLDATMLTDLAALPGVSDAGSFGSAEVVLYNPEERFKNPRERAAYLEGCREQLAATGLSLTAGSFNIAPIATSPEGGVTHEA